MMGRYVCIYYLLDVLLPLQCKKIPHNFINDSIGVGEAGLIFSTVWNVSSICNLPTNHVFTYTIGLFPNTTSIKELEKLENKVSIFPNPVRDVFTINIEEGILVSQLEIIDLQGRLVKSYQTFKTKFDVSSVERGVYFLKITTSSGVAMKKIVVV